MATQRNRNLPGNRLARGAAILKAAQEVDTSLVKERLSTFAKAHTRYVAAQQDVDAADARLRQRQARLIQSDAEQDHAVEQLARELIYKGQVRANPFTVFGAPAPSTLKLLPYAEEAKAIHDLVTAMQRNPTLAKTTLEAAQVADTAARAVEAALAAIEAAQVVLTDLRQTRDTIGQTWETTLGALKRGARAAADDGAPGLYTALFGRPIRTTKKAPAAVITQPAVTTPAAAPVVNAA